MQSFKSKVAVITGGGSGIGFGIGKVLAREGAQVVLADIEGNTLAEAVKELELDGNKACGVITNVSDLASIEHLRDYTLEKYGRVDLLFNNAGVCTINCIKDLAIEDWRWVIDVNLWGVIYGIHTFLPVLLEQGDEAHIVNTASSAGMISCVPFQAPYAVTKTAVISLSETLQAEMTAMGAPISVTALCPGRIDTDIMKSDRNRHSGMEKRSDEAAEYHTMVSDLLAADDALSPEELGIIVIEALREKRFWLATHDEMKPLVESRFQDMLNAYVTKRGTASGPNF